MLTPEGYIRIEPRREGKGNGSWHSSPGCQRREDAVDKMQMLKNLWQTWQKLCYSKICYVPLESWEAKDFKGLPAHNFLEDHGFREVYYPLKEKDHDFPHTVHPLRK